MPVYAYWAYGLRIHAELACPGLLAQDDAGGQPDVTVHLLEPAALPRAESYCEIEPECFRLGIAEVGQYRVEQGRRIFVQPLPGAELEKVQIFLMGSVLGALLYQRGLFPLHGSAVETRWGGMIFVGTQGIGKSTLAAEFHRQGYRLLSDDICALTLGPEGIRILPALTQFRLCADAFERLRQPAGSRFDVDKFVVPMGEGFCPHPVALRAVHVLANEPAGGAGPSYDPVRGFHQVRLLLENLYRPNFLKGQSTQQELMQMAARIAQQSTLAVVSRQRDASEIAGMVGFLESAWTKRFSGSREEEKMPCAV